MAKNASELTRKVLQNIRTTKSNEQIKAILSGTVAMGEIAVQLGTGNTTDDKEYNTGLWVLAQDGITPVRFASQRWVEKQLSELTSGASTQGRVVENIINSVGLVGGTDENTKGTMPSNWKEGTTYISSASTDVLGAIKDLDEAIKKIDDIVLDDLNLEHANADDDKIIYDFAQHDGLVGSAQTKNVGEFTLAGYTGGTDTKIAASQKLNTALGNLQAQIDAMDKAADAKAGHVVTTVTEADGKITETKELLTNIVLSGYNGDHGTVTSADTLGQAIDKIEDEIAAAVNAVTVASSDNSITVTTGANGTDIAVNVKNNDPILSTEGGNGIFSTLNLVKITTGLPETVKERYQLQGIGGTQIGQDIDIAKDSHIVSITYISDPTNEHYQDLEYVYIDASGNTQTTYVNMSNLVFESEFKSGVTATNGIVHGVVDPQSETFLTVDADGFKLSGVQAAIDAAKASGKTEINTTVGGDATKTHLTITSGTAADGHTVYEFVLNDVASASALTALSGSVLDLDATVTGKTADNHVAIEIVETDGKLTSVTLTGTDIASASALTAEITRAKAAEAEIANLVGITGDEGNRSYDATGNYLGTGDNKSVKDDIETLDAIIGSYDDGTTATTYDVTFTTGNTVAKSISDLKKEIADAKSALTLTATDDNKYIDATVTTAATGTEIHVVGVAQDIATSTSATTGIADAYNVKQFAVSAVKDNATNGGSTRIAVVTEEDVKKLDVSNLCVDCGEF